jgi:hypothetical protein
VTACHQITIKTATMSEARKGWKAPSSDLPSPLLVALNGGWERLLESVTAEEFVFVVNGESVESSVLEAVLISEKVHRTFQSTARTCVFHVDDERLNGAIFRRFLAFVRSRELRGFTREEVNSFVSICRLLGNDQLLFLLLDVCSSDWGDEGVAVFSESLRGSQNEVFEGQDVDRCASKFHGYSKALIGSLDKGTLHAILNSRSLKLSSEDDFLETLIFLGEDYFEFWDRIEVSCLTASGLSLFIEHLSFDKLTAIVWEKVVTRLKGVEEETFKFRYFERDRESTIFCERPSILSEFFEKKWHVVYRGSRDGFGAATFHAKCNGQSNTLTVIETTKGFIFGGFTPVGWASHGSGIYLADTSKKSFLFTLKNARSIAPRRFSLSSPSHAIFSRSRFGPIFGSNHDIQVGDNCNASTGNYTYLGGGYANDTGIDGKQVFTGEYTFQVKEIEVFRIDL